MDGYSDGLIIWILGLSLDLNFISGFQKVLGHYLFTIRFLECVGGGGGAGGDNQAPGGLGW